MYRAALALFLVLLMTGCASDNVGSSTDPSPSESTPTPTATSTVTSGPCRTLDGVDCQEVTALIKRCSADPAGIAKGATASTSLTAWRYSAAGQHFVGQISSGLVGHMPPGGQSAADLKFRAGVSVESCGRPGSTIDVASLHHQIAKQAPGVTNAVCAATHGAFVDRIPPGSAGQTLDAQASCQLTFAGGSKLVAYITGEIRAPHFSLTIDSGD